MSVNAIVGSSSTTSEWYARMQQVQQTVSQLSQALSSGNLAAAQTAFSSLQQALPQSSQSGQSSQLQKDMSTLSAALKSGSTSAAQKAFAAVQQDLKSGGHRHSKSSSGSSPVSDLLSMLSPSTAAASAGSLSISV